MSGHRTQTPAASGERLRRRVMLSACDVSGERWAMSSSSDYCFIDWDIDLHIQSPNREGERQVDEGLRVGWRFQPVEPDARAVANTRVPTHGRLTCVDSDTSNGSG